MVLENFFHSILQGKVKTKGIEISFNKHYIGPMLQPLVYANVARE